MQDNQDDLYILSQPPEDIALSSQPFLDNPLVVVARQDHPLVGEKNIPIKSLILINSVLEKYLGNKFYYKMYYNK